MRRPPKGGVDIKRAACTTLRRGGIVLYPTDTLYGLGVDAHNEEALERLIALKGRAPEKGISVLVADKDDLFRYIERNEFAEQLVDNYLPGPLTIVGRATCVFSSFITGGTEKVAVRIPDSKLCNYVAKAFSGPITATSANVSGMEPVRTIDGLTEQFGEKTEMIDLAIDGGALTAGTPSTVVDVSGSEIEILREGAISRAALHRCITTD